MSNTGDFIGADAPSTGQSDSPNPAAHLAKTLKGQQTPSVGRVVHYVAYGTPGGEYPAGAHRAAIVTEFPPQAASDAPLVGLCILNPTGLFFTRDVRYDGSAVPGPGTWHWPEYVAPPKPETVAHHSV